MPKISTARVSTARKPRLRIDLKLYKDGKRVLSTHKFVRSRVVAACEGDSAPEWTSGTIKVWYSRADDYWNAGEFTDIETLQQLLAEFTEWQLIKEYAV